MSQLIEDFNGPIHPHARPVAGDLREEVCSQIDGEPPPTLEQLAHERAAAALRCVFEAVLEGVKLERDSLALLGRRFLTAVWVINPSIVNAGEPISLTCLAKRLSYSAALLSPDASEMSARLGVANCYQHSHDSKSGRHSHLHPREDASDEQPGNESNDGEQAMEDTHGNTN